MFVAIAVFEFRYHLKSPLFAATAVIFFALAFAAITASGVQIGVVGNVKANSPYAIATTLGVLSVFAVFIVAAFVANVVIRDEETRFGAIVRTTRIAKFDYLFARFAGALAAASVMFAAVPLGMLCGSLMPWVDPDKMGPTVLSHYLWVYSVFSVPTLFVTGAGCFALATATRSIAGTYVGVIVFLLLFFIATGYYDKPQFAYLVGLFEPFGMGAYDFATRYWTAAERNTELPVVGGLILWNRALWIGIAIALLALAWVSYHPEKGRAATRGLHADLDAQAPPEESAGAMRYGRPRWHAATAHAQLFALMRFDMAAVFRSPAFSALLGVAFVNAFAALWYANQTHDNTIYPVTRVMIDTLHRSFTFLALVVAIYYAGELVWRDRERNVAGIIDATPAPDWTFLLAKMGALAAVLLTTVAASTLAAITVQLLKGYTAVRMDEYLFWYVLPRTVDLVLIAVLALFIQTLVPHKMMGWLLMLLYVASRATFDRMGLEDHLYQYASGPATPLSDMNGQGNFAAYRGWFRAYWTAFAGVLATLALLLWQRGAVSSLRSRLALVPQRLHGARALVLGAAGTTTLTLGAFIFWNTHVRNEFRTDASEARWLADYEKTLLPFAALPTPKIASVRLQVELYPRATRAVTTGRYAIENRSGVALSHVHIRWPTQLDMRRLEVAGAYLEREFPRFNYRIYRFHRPLAVGERGTIDFVSVREQVGFRNKGNDTKIVANGTFLNDTDIAPVLGMNNRGLLEDRHERRKYGLPPPQRLPLLEDELARDEHYIRNDADWVTADITVTTDADQIPIAPGYRVSDTTLRGRRTIRYRSDAPILPFFSVQSAAYAVRKESWRGVDLAVYYHPAHAYNVSRMLSAMRATLDYASRNFSPYQFRQLRILEFPAYARFAQSFANTVPFSESFGFISQYDTRRRIDMVTYVTAHEVAHQWWGHQVIGARMQGMTLLSETLSQYTALMVLEHLYGPETVRRFLRFELDHYLRRRGTELVGERPLLEVEDQNYIHYRKGVVVMYLLKDTIGEATINRALRALLEDYAFKGAPYPTSRDLIRCLREAARPEHQALITDLFEKITLYDVQVTAAEKARRSDGQWTVSLVIDAHKRYADELGHETDAPLAAVFDVGAFSVAPDHPRFAPADVLAFERRRLRSGRQTVTLVSAREPVVVGVDPYGKWVDRNPADNLRVVEMKKLRTR